MEQERYEIDFGDSDPADVEVSYSQLSYACLREYSRVELVDVSATIRLNKRFSPAKKASVLDMSRSGVGILCQRKYFSMGNEISITIGNRKLTGTIIYCQHLDERLGYRYGIRFSKILSISDMFYYGLNKISI
ncbi:PilZ domain-containing protein [Vibrio parahaemolyticus]